MDWRLAGSWDQTLLALSWVLDMRSVALWTAAVQMATVLAVPEAAAAAVALPAVALLVR